MGFQIIEQTVTIGDHVYLGQFIHIRPNVVIGDYTEIRDFCFLAEGCRIGKNTRIMQYTNICSEAVIGDWCFIGMGVIMCNDQKITYPKDNGKWVKSPPIIENNVRIGAGSMILPGVVLAEGCRIGAGSVVTKSTEPGKTYVGNPARGI